MTPILREIIKDHYNCEAFSNTRPTGAKGFWEKWSKEALPLPQPDIDLLIVGRHIFIGIEIKYFWLENGGLNRSYYEGIGQALALLRYGFDHVQLWHCFDQKVDAEKVVEFMKNTHVLISSLQLPIRYAALKVAKEEDEITAKELVYTPYKKPPFYEEDRPPNPESSNKTNPFREMKEVKRMREFIRILKGIPETK